MKTEVHYYRVEIREACFTFIGGQTIPGTPGKVWLCKPDGEPVLEIAADCVTPTTREETAQRIQQERHASKAPLN